MIFACPGRFRAREGDHEDRPYTEMSDCRGTACRALYSLTPSGVVLSVAGYFSAQYIPLIPLSAIFSAFSAVSPVFPSAIAQLTNLPAVAGHLNRAGMPRVQENHESPKQKPPNVVCGTPRPYNRAFPCRVRTLCSPVFSLAGCRRGTACRALFVSPHPRAGNKRFPAPYSLAHLGNVPNWVGG